MSDSKDEKEYYGGYNPDHDFSTHEDAHPGVQVNDLPGLPLSRLIIALKRLRVIVETQKLSYANSDAMGDKYNFCSWGMCSVSSDLWPDPKDHTWPYAFMSEGRVAPLRHSSKCPLSRYTLPGHGCFYSCSVFTARCKTPSRKTALAWIDEYITELEFVEAGRA